MVAGRELDALVAEKVMGHVVQHDEQGPYIPGEAGHKWPPPPYSTDIAAAWQVFMHFADVYKVLAHVQRQSLGWSLGQPLEWTCTIGAKNTQKADTAPLAICLAALKAAGVEL